MDDKSKKRWLYIALFLAALVIVWLLLRKNDAVQQIIKQNVPWAVPLLGESGGGNVYNIPSLNYVPATMPAISSAKCDSNSPCIFCTIPNVTYPSKPVKSVAPPTYVTQQVVQPKSFQQPTNIITNQISYVTGGNPIAVDWRGDRTLLGYGGASL